MAGCVVHPDMYSIHVYLVFASVYCSPRYSVINLFSRAQDRKMFKKTFILAFPSQKENPLCYSSIYVMAFFIVVSESRFLCRLRDHGLNFPSYKPFLI